MKPNLSCWLESVVAGRGEVELQDELLRCCFADYDDDDDVHLRCVRDCPAGPVDLSDGGMAFHGSKHPIDKILQEIGRTDTLSASVATMSRKWSGRATDLGIETRPQSCAS